MNIPLKTVKTWKKVAAIAVVVIGGLGYGLNLQTEWFSLSCTPEVANAPVKVAVPAAVVPVDPAGVPDAGPVLDGDRDVYEVAP